MVSKNWTHKCIICVCKFCIKHKRVNIAFLFVCLFVCLSFFNWFILLLLLLFVRLFLFFVFVSSWLTILFSFQISKWSTTCTEEDSFFGDFGFDLLSGTKRSLIMITDYIDHKLWSWTIYNLESCSQSNMLLEHCLSARWSRSMLAYTTCPKKAGPDE